MNDADLAKVLDPATLPNGRLLPNRLVKAPTYEHLAAYGGGLPNEALLKLYRAWGRGRWSMVITGNVQISSSHLSLGADMLVPSTLTDSSIRKFAALAASIKSPDGEENGSLAVMQISHAGRQSPNFLGGRVPFLQHPLSASATRVGGKAKGSVLNRALNALLFQEARAMTESDIDGVVDGFVRGARLAHRSGFDGVQLHAAHGYLIAQFISRKSNLRTDQYEEPLALLRRIFHEIRASVPSKFIVGIKLNSSEYSSGGLREQDGIVHLKEISQWNVEGAGVDFIEISGGDYESPDFTRRTSTRQAMFETFSNIATKTIRDIKGDTRAPLVMLTGGLRTLNQFSDVLDRNHAHLLGVARLAITQPSLPLHLYETREKPDNKELLHRIRAWETEQPPISEAPGWWPPLIGAGVEVAWHNVAMRRISRGERQPGRMNPLSIMLEMYLGTWWLPLPYIITLSVIYAILVLGLL